MKNQLLLASAMTFAAASSAFAAAPAPTPATVNYDCSFLGATGDDMTTLGTGTLAVGASGNAAHPQLQWDVDQGKAFIEGEPSGLSVLIQEPASQGKVEAGQFFAFQESGKTTVYSVLTLADGNRLVVSCKVKS